ncbi:hypothetical protein HHK36_015548 [Tetracentron sinense]|uniref:Sugar phosphate transporter domain-containing protein n=1 Tax=Tetracentron sinense TaxID=13715 RepID=A0A835DG95_TETSI|nr:hypothetical protein HHK36_015548 [Tetracentron sinense]
MQNGAFALPPSTPFLKTFKPTNQNPNRRFNLILLSYSPKSLDLTSIHGVSCSSCLRSSSLRSSSRSSSWISAPSLLSYPGTKDFMVRATSVPDSADESAKSNSMMQTLQLGSMFGVWYILNIYFNILNKQVLKVFPFPVTITTFQFGCGSAISILVWTFNLYKRPKISVSQLAMVLPLAVLHTMGNLFTNLSLGKVAVSFTHTIKAMEPFFSVVLAALFLGEVRIPYSVPFSCFSLNFFLECQDLNVRELCVRSLLSGLCFHSYQQVSYSILQMVSPVTHSVGNCVKRVVVIVTSVLFFQTPVSPINCLGTAVALAGVFLYSRVKQIKPKPKPKMA